MHKKIEIHAGDIIKEWEVLEFIGDDYWKCRCTQCGRIKNIHNYNLIHKNFKRCTHSDGETPDEVDKRFGVCIGQKFGEWTVIGHVKNYKVLCRCSCNENKTREINVYHLKSGKSTSCGHTMNQDRVIDLTGQQFGELVPFEYVGDGRWNCHCSCGNDVIKQRSHLLDGRATSCGHATIPKPENIKGNRYGRLVAVEYVGKKSWKCKCDCGNEVVVMTVNLKNGSTKSCGCLAGECRSSYETEIYEIFSNENCVQNDRRTIPPLELDLLFKDRNLAIEIDGTYWHSDIHKEKNYHQKKSKACALKGIRLIHIFEHEWLDEPTKKKLIAMINDDKTKIYGRETIIKEISNLDSEEFLNKYHLKGYTPASINLGCFYNDELIGVMTFGAPRFSSNYQYEMIRFAWKSDVRVVGGANKLFKYFIRKYNPTSVLSYCDFTKFIGSSYKEMGFSFDCLTEPGYHWVDKDFDVLTRYQTTKAKLIKEGFGNLGDTEDEIMRNRGFYKIYDSGNLRFVWKRD